MQACHLMKMRSPLLHSNWLETVTAFVPSYCLNQNLEIKWKYRPWRVLEGGETSHVRSHWSSIHERVIAWVNNISAWVDNKKCMQRLITVPTLARPVMPNRSPHAFSETSHPYSFGVRLWPDSLLHTMQDLYLEIMTWHCTMNAALACYVLVYNT